MGIQGENGQQLSEKWKMSEGEDGVHTHLGLMTVGFPNMIFVNGPQAPSGVGITPYLAEVQGRWIAQLVEHMRGLGQTRVESLPDAEKAWKAAVDRAADGSLLGKTTSWYNGVNIDGRKKEALCYQGGVGRYVATLEHSAARGYPGFFMS